MKYGKKITTASEAVDTFDVESGSVYTTYQIKDDGEKTFNPLDRMIRFTPVEGGTTKIWLLNNNNNPNCEYSIDGGNTWQEMPRTTIDTAPLETGATFTDTIIIRGKNLNGWSHGENACTTIQMSGSSVHASGNVMALIDWETEVKEMPCDFCFYGLFYNYFSEPDYRRECVQLLDGIEIIDDLKVGCYEKMFRFCRNIKHIPFVNITHSANRAFQGYCYGCWELEYCPLGFNSNIVSDTEFDYAFAGCSKLKYGPNILPATTLANRCYSNMFNGCHSLKAAPELPATILANNCYYNMFNHCHALKRCPNLPATELASGCCLYMFNDCSGLTETPYLTCQKLINNCYQHMFNKCIGLTETHMFIIGDETEVADAAFNNMYTNCVNLKTIHYNISQHMTSKWEQHNDNAFINVPPGGTVLVYSDARTISQVGTMGGDGKIKTYFYPQGWSLSFVSNASTHGLDDEPSAQSLNEDLEDTTNNISTDSEQEVTE